MQRLQALEETNQQHEGHMNNLKQILMEKEQEIEMLSKQVSGFDMGLYLHEKFKFIYCSLIFISLQLFFDLPIPVTIIKFLVLLFRVT